MKKLLYPLLILFLSLLVSCESSDSETTPDCKIIKYNKYSENQETVLYRTELIWQGDLITHRQNYGNIVPSASGQGTYGLLGRDSIVYNQNNLAEKIYYPAKGIRIENYDLFYYYSNNQNPYKRENKITYENGYVDKFIEDILYENDRIKKTTGYWIDEPEYLTITDFIYDPNGNLIQTVETSHPNFNSYERVATTTYSDYDDHKNPFKAIEVPFLENRYLKYSENNFKKKIQTIREDGVLTQTYQSETSNYQYNSQGYPLIAEYLCH